MSLYRHKVTGDVKELDPAQIQAWIDAGNQKGAHYRDEWEPYTPPAPEQPTRWQVKRDTVWNRLRTLLGPDALHEAFDRLPPRDYREFFANEFFWSDNPWLRGYLTNIRLDPDVILAPEDSGP